MPCALICHTDIRIREQLKKHLPGIGYQQVLACNQRDNALELAIDHHPDLMLLEAAAPISGSKLAASIRKIITAATILLVRTDEQEHLKQAINDQIDAFLTTPFPLSDSTVALELAIRSATRTAALRQELELTKAKLQDRKIIERAKGLLMEMYRISEDAAFRMLRSQSMARRLSMAALAEEYVRTGTRQGSP